MKLQKKPTNNKRVLKPIDYSEDDDSYEFINKSESYISDLSIIKDKNKKTK